jgi:predicted transcriptional regulator
MTQALTIRKKKDSLPVLKNSIKHISPRRGKFKLTVRKVALPQNESFDEQIAWVCSSLGFFENIDKSKNAAQIFKEIFLAGSLGQVLTSTTISERVGMSRGSTINHLNNLLNAGLIEKGGKYYFARHKTMKGTIDEIEDDITHIFSRMKRIAKEIDSETDQVIRMK